MENVQNSSTTSAGADLRKPTTRMADIRFPKLLIFINALVPLALMLWDVYQKRVGANPLEFVTRTTGMLTLVFLMFTLAISPVRQITGINWLVKFRRLLGLFAFFYGTLHLATYIWFDRFFNFRSIPGDVVQRPFITFGMLAFFLMVPLAITSTNKMVKRLGGKRWSKLHLLIYAAGVAGVLHFWLLVKSDLRLPLTFGFVLLLLLAHRVFVKFYPPAKSVSG
ncbi:MAG TPA: protein-methionine-sulfoxide reductase heme-binding subunit MsrQ [Pyrinomonadaceae bacterium]|nr:protein-methionine-sulfoxide reductase heme-binding subunit MsrQ [Pyrinomonadaceae bacterium]